MNEKSQAITNFVHPPRAAYLLGAEDNGLPKKVLDKCHQLVMLDKVGSLNVAVTGSIVTYDRITKWGEQK
jgi:tRNA G18 (ribose-2'-O)-methylase SpoU